MKYKCVIVTELDMKHLIRQILDVEERYPDLSFGSFQWVYEDDEDEVSDLKEKLIEAHRKLMKR